MSEAFTRLEPGELPHAGAMRWVEAVALSADGVTARAEFFIGAEHAFVSEGELAASALLELMAQTAAGGAVVHARRAQQRVVRGMLAGVRAFESLAPVRVGDTVTITAVREKTLGALSQAAFEARVGGQLVARGRLMFHTQIE